jgi:hypothetical protein
VADVTEQAALEDKSPNEIAKLARAEADRLDSLLWALKVQQATRKSRSPLDSLSWSLSQQRRSADQASDAMGAHFKSQEPFYGKGTTESTETSESTEA